MVVFFFFSSRRRHTRWNCDWSSDVCSSDLDAHTSAVALVHRRLQARQANRGPGIAHEHGPGGIGRREADVDDDDLAAPLARQKMAAPRAAEGDRELRAH